MRVRARERDSVSHKYIIVYFSCADCRVCISEFVIFLRIEISNVDYTRNIIELISM